MPAFATLIASDIATNGDWYINGLGFVELFSMPGPGRVPVLVHLRRWAFQDLLVRPAPDSVVSGNSVTLSFAAVPAERDEFVTTARAHGGDQILDPVETCWNTRDIRTIDPDGNTVIFTAGRPLAEGRGVPNLP